MTAVQIKKILLAVDLSPHTHMVTEYAAYLAKTFGAEILAVHVVPALVNYGRFKVPDHVMENYMKEVVGGAEKSIDEFVKKEFQGCKAQGLVLSGDVADEILKLAEESSADFIVMGTNSRGKVERFFFGSEADKVVKRANIPVLTVRC